MKLTIEGQVIAAEPSWTILDAATAAKIYVPSLCAHPDLPAQKDHLAAAAVFWGEQRYEHAGQRDEVGCGICVVVADGERVAACATPVRAGMIVTTQSEQLSALRRQRLSAILAEHPHACLTCSLRQGCSRDSCSMNVPPAERCCSLLGNCELQAVAEHVGIDPATRRYVPPDEPRRFEGEPLFVRDLALCIACGRCARACSRVGVEALGWVNDKDNQRRVGPLAPTPVGAGCRLCGSCVEVCPTGALRDRNIAGDRDHVPCRTACPAGTDVPRYLRLAAQRRWGDAAATVAERAPLVEVLGHVCYHPCEAVCRRVEVNAAPLAICAIKRQAGAEAAVGWAERLPEPLPSSGKKVAVVGAGPAGLVAAFLLRLSGHQVTLFEKRDKLGGLLQWGIPPFRLPREVVDRETEALVAGIEVQTGVNVGCDVTIAALRQQDAVVLATGAAQSVTLDDVEGARLPGVLPGILFLEQVATGAARCSDKRVVVIGGGNVAIDCARAARRLGAEAVDLVCLERADEMPAFEAEVLAAVNEGVVMHDGYGVARFVGDEALRAIVLQSRVSDEVRELRADIGIVAIGQRPDRSILPEELAGVFVAGDLASGPSSVIEAIASGRCAALEADRFVGGQGQIDLELVADDSPSTLCRVEGFATLPRAEPNDGSALGAERAQKEADRCLQCDLRLRYRAPPRPPGRPRLELCEEQLEQVPEAAGVVRFYSGDGDLLEIIGVPDMRQEAASRLGGLARVERVTFDCEPCAMYTQRQNELLSQYMELHGEAPRGVGEDDGLDDLF